jgi:hypothetical protein
MTEQTRQSGVLRIVVLEARVIDACGLRLYRPERTQDDRRQDQNHFSFVICHSLLRALNSRKLVAGTTTLRQRSQLALLVMTNKTLRMHRTALLKLHLLIRMFLFPKVDHEI